MKIRLYLKGGETVVKYAQKKSTKFVKIVNTSLCVHDTIINVKTPQYIIYFSLIMGCSKKYNVLEIGRAHV